MIRKLLTLCFLIFVLTLMLQTTNMSRYSPVASAQSYGGEYDTGNPASWPPCTLCGCSFNSGGDCCCGGVSNYYCLCSCGVTYICGTSCP
jgi:hypothetical protein